MKIQAYAAQQAGGKLQSFDYNVDRLKSAEVEIDIEYCGICHSDLGMLNNDWGITQYPFVPGHENCWQGISNWKYGKAFENWAICRHRLASALLLNL